MAGDPYNDIPDWLKQASTPPPAAPTSWDAKEQEPEPAELPDWLAQMRPGAQPAAAQAVPREESFTPLEAVDVEPLGDPQAAPSKKKQPGLLGILQGLSPQQRLILAVLFFLDVILLGCMCLVMTGRVVPPSP